MDFQSEKSFGKLRQAITHDMLNLILMKLTLE